MNLAEKLATEIQRVAELRAQYVAIDGISQVNVKPALFMIDAALAKARAAAGIEDAIEQMDALRTLETFTA